MTIGAETSLKDLAFIVCTVLARAGETAVLSGGGAATVYAPDAYQSKDLDFIFTFWSALAKPSGAPLNDLGFKQKNGTYHHDLTPFTVEFPPGPLAVGEEELAKWDTLHSGDLLLHIITPTDCVRDRLSWFLFGDDYASLEQALAVARCQTIDLDVIESWCKSEGASAKFAMFKARLGP